MAQETKEVWAQDMATEEGTFSRIGTNGWGGADGDYCLMNMVDDATGVTMSLFDKEEQEEAQ